MEVAFLLIHLSFALFLFFLILAFLTGAPYVPTANTAAESMMRLARIHKGATVIDLGSGDGKLLLRATKEGAGLAIGYEMNPYLVLVSRIRSLMRTGKGNIRVYWKNFWRADISAADVVFVYLLPWRMDELAQKLRRELKPGALVVSNSFIFSDWKIVRQDIKHHVYVFRMVQ